MTQVLKNPRQFQAIQNSQRKKGLSQGFVPTMGALHEGHLSLVRHSLEKNCETSVSIFVNPAQFNQSSDLENYPNSLSTDKDLLTELGVDRIFIPTAKDMYPDDYTYQLIEKNKSKILCGALRPGHFEGVLTVVLKFLLLAQAHHAYFGEKDFQQLELIRGLKQAFFIPTKIEAVPTHREDSGLAMSSRNRHLSKQGLKKAGRFNQILRNSPDPKTAYQQLVNEGFEVDYIEEYWGRRFGAVFLEQVRLIDNVLL